VLSRLVCPVVYRIQQFLTIQSAVLRLPPWLPGMRLKKVAPFVKQYVLEVLENPFAHTERGLVGVT